MTANSYYTEGEEMDDYTVSKIARQEYEQRVRAYTPARDHDHRFTDDRQLSLYPIRAGIVGTFNTRRKSLLAPIARMVLTIAMHLASALIWIRLRRVVSPQVPLTEEEHQRTELSSP